MINYPVNAPVMAAVMLQFQQAALGVALDKLKSIGKVVSVVSSGSF